MNTNNKWIKISLDLLRQVLAIVLYFALTIGIVYLFYSLFGREIAKNSYANILVELIVLFVFLIIFRKKIIPEFYDFKKNYKKYIKKYYKYWLFGLLVMVVTNVLISFYMAGPSNEDVVREYFKAMPLYYCITAIILAPMTEEIMTRGILNKTFKYPIIYYLLTSLIFALLHIHSLNEIIYIIPYGALGFAFAKMYHDSDCIWVNIFFHSLHNLIATILLIIEFGGF